MKPFALNNIFTCKIINIKKNQNIILIKYYFGKILFYQIIIFLMYNYCKIFFQYYFIKILIY